ncbi:glycosyltransferase family 2 protein [Agarivorans litoreus]|uniref:glycosyltransferase family 2 protein n=1 Tax=Agarivorans litoreus TaxID=1510455 RepID=UPI001C7CB4A8|nr:glycosyltransferase [Agarivorans litoreus]
MNITVIVRVYNRLDDLACCLQVINQLWQQNNYHVVLVSNGKNAGYVVSEELEKYANVHVCLEENAGHLKGNSQLLQAAIPYIADDSEYTVILEADTWLLDDSLITRYCRKMSNQAAVWSSASWISNVWSVGLDFAIISSDYLRANPKLVDYGEHPEKTVCNYLLEDHQRFLFIKENMPVHPSKLFRTLYPKCNYRFNSFIRSKMVTHHIEELDGGLAEKKRLANLCLDDDFFPVNQTQSRFLFRLKCRLIALLVVVLPQSSWFKPKRRWQG